MPPKSTRQGGGNKQDLSDKVKEIKQRQQNWFKQREQSLKSSLTPDRTDEKCVGDKDPFLPSHHVKKPTSKNINRQTVTVKRAAAPVSSPGAGRKNKDNETGFHAWRERQNQRDLEEEPFDDSSEYAETESTDIPLYSDVESYRSDVPSRVNSVQMDVQGGTLSPDQFDALADQIIHRVKKELNVPPDKPNMRNDVGHAYPQHSYALRETRGRSESPSQGAARIESHYCSKCSELMLPPAYQPMLVIPCAHSICAKCAERNNVCPVCSSEISSVTCNIMLQQIIVDYKNKKLSVRSSSRSCSANQYSEPDRDYSEEYKTLSIRCEVLQAEEESINERINDIRQQVKREEKQVDNIAKEERKIQEAIIEMQRKLQALNGHKEEYREKCKALEVKEEEERGKLALCVDTRKQLQREAAQIKKYL